MLRTEKELIVCLVSSLLHVLQMRHANGQLPTRNENTRFNSGPLADSLSLAGIKPSFVSGSFNSLYLLLTIPFTFANLIVYLVGDISSPDWHERNSLPNK
ncbi:hypothetical protein NPIL_416561 [Nephila pilipes]|uniref:Uncharacterized protein n=1 Tax=Nephila pilipes TaxID=299642 RepID=A0A8X6P2J0_NEPPI|nr:hypothetical protein NPIL_416561 [Nephila pilipes]